MCAREPLDLISVYLQILIKNSGGEGVRTTIERQYTSTYSLSPIFQCVLTDCVRKWLPYFASIPIIGYEQGYERWRVVVRNKLTDIKCRTAVNPGVLGDGGGLYLRTKKTGTKSWIFVWKKDGRRNETGLGAYPDVGLARARERATRCRELVADGRNPVEERRKETEPTFAACADMFLASMEGQWRNPKHRAQWRMTLTAYCAVIRNRKVSEIGTEEVLAVLQPLWRSRPETASRLRGRIERVLDFAKARGWRRAENPALWRGHLKNILPARQKLTRGHHAAMPYRDLPAFVQLLSARDAMAAKALEFLILTAGRAGEVLGAQWDEFDLEAALWTIPARRMKAGKEHRVPLSDRAMAIIKELHENRISEFAFPGLRRDRPLSNMAFKKLMERMGVTGVTAHGFRSAFRDWAGDCTKFPREVAEQALAHRVGDATELAYRRADALEKRRELMDAWTLYCCEEKAPSVLKLVG